MEESGTSVGDNPPQVEESIGPSTETKTEEKCDKINESRVVLDECKVVVDLSKEISVEHEISEVNDDARSLGDLDSLPAGDELVLGAAGSDSGVEGCGRALSSGGGSRSCASSVVSCGSGCGSESSSLAGAPPRSRRRVNVTVPETKRNSPLSTSTPRPVTAPRGPNLATRERARSREKPTPPEKPRPLTPKPRLRPTGELPNLVRESPALRAKPTKTSAARCRTPNSPTEDKSRWPSVSTTRLSTVSDASATRVAADKYGTLPRRRKEPDLDGSPKHDATPPSRRSTITRSMSSRSTTKTRVRIYAEKNSQTVLLGTDVESALAGLTPSIESRIEVSRCHKGVQANARDAEIARLNAAVATANAIAEEERERRLQTEVQLATERAARLAASAELEKNTQRLLELAGAGAGAGADGSLKALEEQLKAAQELAARQQSEIDAMRARCDKLSLEASSGRETIRTLEVRLADAEREAGEMQEFLACETGALADSLREAESELAKTKKDLEQRRGECRQLVRMCEQRRQEALAAQARARQGGGAAIKALDGLLKRLQALTDLLIKAYRLPIQAVQPTVYHNDAYSRSDSGDALTPEEEPRGLLAAVARAFRNAPVWRQHSTTANDDEKSRVSDENDNSADLLDSETEPCLDPDLNEEWWSGPEGAGAWSGEDLSPEREWVEEPDAETQSASERDSLRSLSAAIAQRHRSEAAAEKHERSDLLDRALSLDARLGELVRALSLAAASANMEDDADSLRLAHALKDKLDTTEKNVAEVVVKKLAELDATKNMMEHYRQNVEALKKQLAQPDEEDDLEFLEEEVRSCTEEERHVRYCALDAAVTALSGAGPWPRVIHARTKLEKLAFALAAAPPSVVPPTRPVSTPTRPVVPPRPVHSTA